MTRKLLWNVVRWVADLSWQEAKESDVPVSIYNHISEQRLPLEVITEKEAGAVDLNRATQGGTDLIRLQSQCPRAALVRYRLGVRPLNQRELGLDPAERGVIVHHVLELVWQQIENSKALAKLSDLSLESLVKTSIKQANQRFRIQSGCGEGFFDTHSRWLQSLILEWFALEKSRELPFEVLHTEKQVNLTLGKIRPALYRRSHRSV